MKAPRRRYGSAGNTDERFDAYVLADTGRTDRRRQTPALLDSEAATALRKLCRARKDMVAVRPAITEALHMHPDRDIFTRLPEAGTVRAARLLAEIGAPAAASPPRLPTPSRPTKAPPRWPVAASTKPNSIMTKNARNCRLCALRSVSEAESLSGGGRLMEAEAHALVVSAEGKPAEA